MSFKDRPQDINRQGRPRQEKMTRRQVKDQELLSILRKIKPHLSDSIMTAATIMKNDKAMDSNRLKAAVILLNAYKELVGDVYNGEEVDDETFENTSAPVFSLKVVEQ